MPSPQRPRARSFGFITPLAALGLLLAGCSRPSLDEGALPSTSASASSVPLPAPPPLPPESIAFPAGKALLADLPAMRLLPRNVSAVVALRSPLAFLGNLASFSEAKASLAQALDDLAKEYGQELPSLSAFAELGIDPSRAFGLVAFDPRFDTVAVFASVSDEAAAKSWLEARSKKAGAKRALAVSEDALTLPSRTGVSPAVVLRKGYVFFLWTREGIRLEPARLTSAAEAVATTKGEASLATDADFSKAMATLAWGQDASVYVAGGQVLDVLLAEHRRVIDPAPGTAKERRENELAAALAPFKAALAGVAVGFEMGERALKVKAFLTRTDAPAVLFDPAKRPTVVFDPSLMPESAFQGVLDRRLLGLVLDVVPRSFGAEPLPIASARATLRSFGVRRREQENRLTDLQAEIRELEGSLDKHRERTFRAFAAQAGKIAFLAKPIEGGVTIYGGVFSAEPTLGALVEAGLGAWLDAGPRWAKQPELERLRGEARDLDKQLNPGR